MDVWLAQDGARKEGKGRIGILIWMILVAMDRREGCSKFRKKVAEMLPFFYAGFIKPLLRLLTFKFYRGGASSLKLVNLLIVSLPYIYFCHR